MKYYIFEQSRNIGGSMTAGVKARSDVEYILDSEGYTRLVVLKSCYPSDSTYNKIKASVETSGQWHKLVGKLNSGDTLVVQLPLSEHTLELGFIIAQLKRKGVKTVAIIHDLEKLRNMKAHNYIKAWKGHIRNFLEETWALKNFTRIIVHNQKMMNLLVDMGYSKERLISLDIFDYVINQTVQVKKVGDPERIIIAGNLLESKAGYVYKLPKDDRLKFSLYGVNYTGITDAYTDYHGAFNPDVLPFVLCGKFGLVWDGPLADTCGGIHGEYLRINNPHKTSLYLAAGIPVIIWNQAAMADFIRANQLGICVDSLSNIADVLSKLNEDDYEQIRSNVLNICNKLRSGDYLKAALKKCSC